MKHANFEQIALEWNRMNTIDIEWDEQIGFEYILMRIYFCNRNSIK